MQKKSKAIVLLATIAIVVAGKLILEAATTENLRFLLAPVAFVVQMASGFEYEYISDRGYYFESANTLIDKSCSGGNFLLIAYSLTVLFLSSCRLPQAIRLLVAAVATLPVLILTITANVSRIYIAMFAIIHSSALGFMQQPLAHQLIGGVVFLFYLVVYYWGLTQIKLRYFST